MLEHDNKTDVFLAKMGVCMHKEDTLEHKEKPKYIAKIGEGVNARYFYTMEAFNAYKKALSSKDEKAAMEKAQNNPNVQKVSSGYITTDKEAGDQLYKTSKDYYDSKKLSGKLADVNATRKELKAERQERKTAKKESKESKPKKELGSGVKEYAKAISSRDEKKEFKKTEAEALEVTSDFKKKQQTYKDSLSWSPVKSKKEKEAKAALEKSADKVLKVKKDYEQKEADYKEAKSITGKAKAVKEVFDKRNPEVSKRIKKGRDWVKSRFR